MLRLLREALRLFFANIFLFAAVILTTAVPTSLFMRDIMAHAEGPRSWCSMTAAVLVGLAVVQISSGAVVHVTSALKRGLRPTYGAAMMTGLNNWGRLVLANAVVGMFVAVGLVVIVPGIIFMVAYALIDPIVVHEQAGPVRAMQRSFELTKDSRWSIFGIVALGLVLSIGSRLFHHYVVEPSASLNTPWVHTAMRCPVMLLYGILEVTLILFYLEARAREAAEPTLDDVDGPEECPESTAARDS